MALGFAWQQQRPQDAVVSRSSTSALHGARIREAHQSPQDFDLRRVGGRLWVVLERGSSPPRALHGARIREAHQSPQDSGVSSLIQIAR